MSTGAKMEKSRAFFKNLAYLFYAFGMADRKFLKQEKHSIINLVEKGGFTEIDTSSAKDLIYQTLKDLIEQDVTAMNAFEIFTTYFIENKQLFTENLRSEIQNGVKQILDVNNRKDKSEIVLLSKLYLLFKEEG